MSSGPRSTKSSKCSMMQPIASRDTSSAAISCHAASLEVSSSSPPSGLKVCPSTSAQTNPTWELPPLAIEKADMALERLDEVAGAIGILSSLHSAPAKGSPEGSRSRGCSEEGCDCSWLVSRRPARAARRRLSATWMKFDGAGGAFLLADMVHRSSDSFLKPSATFRRARSNPASFSAKRISCQLNSAAFLKQSATFRRAKSNSASSWSCSDSHMWSSFACTSSLLTSSWSESRILVSAASTAVQILFLELLARPSSRSTRSKTSMKVSRKLLP
mmetsp:Transcript_36685/g.84633  ORF Transcript_36685/g.84633 Transcript_36685/m.84633 type:complete len:274 (+) Transcript_36685:128-949(+)